MRPIDLNMDWRTIRRHRWKEEGITKIHEMSNRDDTLNYTYTVIRRYVGPKS